MEVDTGNHLFTIMELPPEITTKDISIENLTAQTSVFNNTNLTVGNHTSLQLSQVVTGMALGAINIMTIFGNILVLTAVFINKKLRTVTNYLVLSLATADLTLGLFVLPFSAIWQLLGKQWIFGSALCEFWAAFDVLCCTASILSLCAISVDRYIGVTEPLRHRHMMSRRRTVIGIAAIWLLSVAISIGPLIGWRDKDPTPGVCSITKDSGYVIFSVLCSFYIPSLVIVVIYTKIYKEAIKQSHFLKTGMKQIKGRTKESPILLRAHSTKHSKSNHSINMEDKGDITPLVRRSKKLVQDVSHPSTPTPNRKPQEFSQNDRNNNKSKSRLLCRENGDSQSSQLNIPVIPKPREKLKQTSGKELMLSTRLIRFNKEKKAAKTLGIVVGIFILCWFPFFFILPLDALCAGCRVPGPLFDVVFWLGYCNSMLNPLIYAMWSREFKNTFISIIKCRCHRRKSRPIPTIITTSDCRDPASRTLRHGGSGKALIQTDSTEIMEYSLSAGLTPSQSHEDVAIGVQ